jgi:hypothetical protein
MTGNNTARPYWSPYAAGIGIGLTMLAAFYILGNGLGASGAFARFAASATHAVAPQYAESNSYFRQYFGTGASPLKDWMVFQVAGIFIGGLIGALTARRFGATVERGSGVSARTRLLLAFAGGTLTGVAARLARGCTSGQALTGGAQLSLGSWAFMFSVFAGGYLAAWFVRRQWRQ